MEENKNLNEQETGANNTVPNFSDAIGLTNKEWLPYDEDKFTEEEIKLEGIASKDLESTLEEYLNENNGRFEYLEADLIKRSKQYKHPSSLLALIENEITETNALVSFPQIKSLGVWAPIYKWAFDNYTNNRTVKLLQARTYQLDSYIQIAMGQGPSLTHTADKYPFLKNSDLLKTYKCFWLESLFYILHGASASRYLEYLLGLKRMADNGQEIDFTGRIKLEWNCPNETIYDIIRQIKHHLKPQTSTHIATFMYHNFKFEKDKHPSIRDIRIAIDRKTKPIRATGNTKSDKKATQRQNNRPPKQNRTDIKLPPAEDSKK